VGNVLPLLKETIDQITISTAKPMQGDTHCKKKAFCDKRLARWRINASLAT
jgi:hypothetical protein